MTSLTSFAQALLNPTLDCPTGLKTWNGSDPEARFAVYRNNVLVSLVDALADTFAVVQELVGEEFFRAMARVFVQAQPPQSRILAYYGTPFADFVQSFAPAASVPYLSDVARLEMARVRAYHAADAAPVPPDALRAVLTDPHRLMTMSLALHPSVQVIESRFAIVSIWRAHQGALDISLVDPTLAQTALVCRNGLHVEVMELAGAAGQLVGALQRGVAPLEAVAGASDGDPAVVLANTIATLVRLELITHLTPGDNLREPTH